MIHVPKCVAALCDLAATETARYSMQGLRIRELAGGAYRVEATNGRVLGILRGVSSPSDGDRQQAEALGEPESLLMEAIVPVKEVTAAIKQLAAFEKPAGRKKQARTLGILLAQPEIILVAGPSVTRCQAVEGRFPDVETVLPKTAAPVSFRVDGEYLIDLLKAAVAVARTTEGRGMANVEFLYWGPTTPIGVIAQGAGEVMFDGLIMPLD